MRNKKYLALVVAAAVVAGCISTGAVFSRPVCKECRESIPEVTGVIKSENVDESSGLAISNSDETIFYTHNDSFGANKVFSLKLDFTNEDQAILSETEKLDVENSINFDWEELADNGDDELYIIDSGNNLKFRRYISVYTLNLKDRTRVYEKKRYSYPAGKSYGAKGTPLYDCEAAYYMDGRIYFITKEENFGPILFSADFSKNSDKMKFVKRLNCGQLVTAADISSDGSKLAVLTYDGIYIYNMEGGLPGVKPVSYMPVSLGQMEALCFKNDTEVVVTSESNKFGIYNLKKFYKF